METTGAKPISGNGLHSRHFKGAAHEYTAATWFLSQGCQVYWPAVQQSHVDFVVDLHGSLKRVQVKTGTWNHSSPPYSYLQCRLLPYGTRKQDARLKPSEMYDLLMVISDAGWWLIPSEEIQSTNLCLASTGPRPPQQWENYRIGKGLHDDQEND